MKPLRGIRVLDFSQIHGASYATMLLADFGAEVIKIENIQGGDRLRNLGPYKDGYSVYHAYLNRNKKSIAVDLKRPEGKAFIKKMAAEVDVLCENFRYDTMEKLGLGYKELSIINEKLVYATLTGYGRIGDKKEQACFDNTAQAFSGMMDMTGYYKGAPITMGAQLGNLYGGMHLATAIVLGVMHVREGGAGQFIDVAAADALYAVLEDGMINWTLLGHLHQRNGNMSLAIAPYDTYKTTDGFVSIGVSSDFQWKKFCKVMGMTDMLDDPRFTTNGKRGENYLTGGLRERIESITSTMSKFEVQHMLDEENIPCGSVCTVVEAMESEQIKHRQMVLEVEDQVAGTICMPGIPVKLSKTPGGVERPAPMLGQHNHEYFDTLNHTQETREKLVFESASHPYEDGKKPLWGVTVLDFTQAFSGPYCTMNLADVGARVIKVERKGIGDQTREWAPLDNDGNSAYYAQYNRNKEGISIDISKEEGKEIIRRMVKKADIVVNNFKVGTLDRQGIGYEEIKKIKPDIIFASINGYGQSGPMSKLAAYDNIIEATCGLMDHSGFPDMSPVRSGCSIGDSYSGLMATFGIVTAYFHKRMTGEGQTVNVAMQDSLFASIEDAILEYGISGEAPKRTGNSRCNIASPYDVMQCKDGWYAIAAITESGWREFCAEAGMPQLVDDPRFINNIARCAHNDALIHTIQPFFTIRTMSELEAIFSCKYFAATPVVNASVVTAHPHMKQRKMVVEVNDPNVGHLKEVGLPVKFEKTVTDVYRPSPLLGQHTKDVLLELGYSSEEIKSLDENDVIDLI